MKLKPDQERVKNLLSDTVALLCKNGLAFEKELKIQGLLGVTIDDNDVFIVHLNESYAGLLAAEEAETASVTSKDSVAPEQKSKDSRNEGGAPKRPHPSPMRSHSQSPHTESKRPRPSSSHLQSPHRRASHSSSNDSVVVQVKQEKEDDIELVEAKSEPNFGGYYGAHSEMGGPHGKRRTEMFPAGNAQEPYITSVMRNPGGGEPGSSWDPNSSQPSTLAHDSQLDATSGSSQWNPGLGLPPGSEGMLGFALPSRPRRSEEAAKSFVCPHEGCDKKYFYKHHLKRHRMELHSEDLPIRPQSNNRFRGGYAQWSQPNSSFELPQQHSITNVRNEHSSGNVKSDHSSGNVKSDHSSGNVKSEHLDVNVKTENLLPNVNIDEGPSDTIDLSSDVENSRPEFDYNDFDNSNFEPDGSQPQESRDSAIEGNTDQNPDDPARMDGHGSNFDNLEANLELNTFEKHPVE